jgi:hypothetical protein
MRRRNLTLLLFPVVAGALLWAGACSGDGEQPGPSPDAEHPDGGMPDGDASDACIPAIDAGELRTCNAGSSSCPRLVIDGDDEVPDGSAHTFFHGFANPSLRQDPVSSRLWLAYSARRVVKASLDGGADIEVYLAENHVAYSDDRGQSFRYDPAMNPLFGAVALPEDGTAGGFYASEVASLTPASGGDDGRPWYSARLRYVVRKAGGYNPVRATFRILVGRAASPAAFHAQTEADMQGLGAGIPGIPPPDVNLASLGAAVTQCNLWTDPAVFVEAGRLYLVAPCNQADTTYRLSVFSTDAVGAVKSWRWRLEGVLADTGLAREVSAQLGLSPPADTLLQPELVRSKDGHLLAIVSPSRSSGNELDPMHVGSIALELEGLEPPRVARDCDGHLRIRAFVTATDQPQGSSSAGYDPSSATGLLFTRRPDGNTTNGVINGFAIHGTGLFP